MKNAIEITRLSKIYQLYERNALDRFKDTFLPWGKKRHREFCALNNINLTINQGEILGIVGRNGAGKSTLLKIISGISPPTSGGVEVNGRLVPLLELGGGFNPDYSGRENIYFYCSLQGMHKGEIDAAYPEIVKFSELKEFIELPVKKYSSGMRARLGFAVSINIDPEILILDEVLSVGDELFKRKCFVKMEEFFKKKKTILYVSHSLSTITQLCHRAILIHKGNLLLEGHPRLVVRNYQRLMNGSFTPEKEQQLMEEILALNNDLEQKEEKTKRIETGDIKKRVTGGTAQNVSPTQQAFFVENFESKSRQLIQKKEVDIINYSLTTLKGKKVNHILWGENYNIQFSACFNETVEKVRLGCVIYNEKTMMISSCFGPERFHSIERIGAGELWNFETRFAAYLKSGLYGIRFTVMGEEERPVATLRDGILFRCSEQQETRQQGIIQLFCPPTFTQLPL